MIRCSEVLAYVPRVHCGLICKFVWSSRVQIVLVEAAAGETNSYAGMNEVVRAPLYFLCSSLREHRVQVCNRSRHRQLHKRVRGMTESDSNEFKGVRELWREAENPRGVSIFDSGDAREKSFPGRTALPSCNQYRHAE